MIKSLALSLLLFALVARAQQCGPMANNVTCYSLLGKAACCSVQGYCGTDDAYCAPGSCASECPWKPSICGDLLCNGDETCSTCRQDCGPCTSATDPIYTTCASSNGNLKMALTFDDGPTPNITDQVLDILRSEGVVATFFVVGGRINLPGGKELVQKAINQGHLVLPHTYSHPDMATLSVAQLRAEMMETEAAYRTAMCGRTMHYMRPPYGSVNDQARQTMANLGYRMVTWNVDSNEAKHITNNDTSMDIFNDIKGQIDALYPNNIILLQHDMYQISVDAVRASIQYAKAKGYTFLKIDDCILGPQNARTAYENAPWLFYWEQAGHGCMDSMHNRLGGGICNASYQCNSGSCVNGYCVCNPGYTCSRCTRKMSEMIYSDLCPNISTDYIPPAPPSPAPSPSPVPGASPSPSPVPGPSPSPSNYTNGGNNNNNNGGNPDDGDHNSLRAESSALPSTPLSILMCLVATCFALFNGPSYWS